MAPTGVEPAVLKIFAGDKLDLAARTAERFRLVNHRIMPNTQTKDA
jgi:hypothetical protein